MPSSRKMILGHVMSGLCSKMNRTKQLPADVMETPLNRCLNTFDITLLGLYISSKIYLFEVVDTDYEMSNNLRNLFFIVTFIFQIIRFYKLGNPNSILVAIVASNLVNF